MQNACSIILVALCALSRACSGVTLPGSESQSIQPAENSPLHISWLLGKFNFMNKDALVQRFWIWYDAYHKVHYMVLVDDSGFCQSWVWWKVTGLHAASQQWIKAWSLYKICFVSKPPVKVWFTNRLSQPSGCFRSAQIARVSSRTSTSPSGCCVPAIP